MWRELYSLSACAFTAGSFAAFPLYQRGEARAAPKFEIPVRRSGHIMKKASASRTELTVISKTYDLILWTANHTSRFPRNHRHVLGTRIENQLYDVLELLIDAKFSRDRRDTLEEANRKLETLRFLLRLGRDLKCLEVSSYGFGTKAVDEIGRLVGGWLRSSDAER